MSGTQELRVTTDAGTDVVVPVEVAAAAKPEPAPEKPAPQQPAPQQPAGDNSSSGEASLPIILASILGVLGLLTLLLANPIDQILGPIAKF